MHDQWDKLSTWSMNTWSMNTWSMNNWSIKQCLVLYSTAVLYKHTWVLWHRNRHACCERYLSEIFNFTTLLGSHYGQNWMFYVSSYLIFVMERNNLPAVDSHWWPLCLCSNLILIVTIRVNVDNPSGSINHLKWVWNKNQTSSIIVNVPRGFV